MLTVVQPLESTACYEYSTVQGEENLATGCCTQTHLATGALDNSSTTL